MARDRREGALFGTSLFTCDAKSEEMKWANLLSAHAEWCSSRKDPVTPFLSFIIQ